MLFCFIAVSWLLYGMLVLRCGAQGVSCLPVPFLDSFGVEVLGVEVVVMSPVFEVRSERHFCDLCETM